MTINTSTPIKNIDGSDVVIGEETLTFGKILSNILSSVKSPDALKSYSLALKFFNDDSVELDKSDEKFVKDLITKAASESSNISPLVAGQLLELF